MLLPSAYGVAPPYAEYNSDYLAAPTICPRVTDIRVDQATHQVYVRFKADASSLFPSLLRSMTVPGEGEAELRLLDR